MQDKEDQVPVPRIKAESTCVGCDKAGAECAFEIGDDGVPRGIEYVACLEARIAYLENELHTHGVDPLHQPRAVSRTVDGSNRDGAHSFSGIPEILPPIPTPETVTLFTMLQKKPETLLAELPSDEAADRLFQTAYYYIQARYCIVDWARLRNWHRQRRSICSASLTDDIDTQTGAFFMWIIYAIGTQLIPNMEQSGEIYYAHAVKYLRPLLELQDITTVQVLLTLVQYHFRAPNGPDIWQLEGTALRLCTALGYHLKPSRSSLLDIHTTELRKRLFWGAYCIDRMVSIITRRPFGIRDEDITCGLPLDVDDSCTDPVLLQEIQASTNPHSITTMSGALHQLHIYRIRSTIMTKFSSPNSPRPGPEDVSNLLNELDLWRQNAPQSELGTGIPLLPKLRIDYIYYQVLVLLFRPILSWDSIDEDLLLSCATLSADACETARQLSLSPHTHNSRITVYNSFRCGITLLQCLAVKANILPTKRIMRAITSCSSALTVYTRTLALAGPFLDLFDKLSDYFLGEESDNPPIDVHGLLWQVTNSDPSEIPELLRSLNEEEGHQNITHLIFSQTTPDQFDFLLGLDTTSALATDFMTFDIDPGFPQSGTDARL